MKSKKIGIVINQFGMYKDGRKIEITEQSIKDYNELRFWSKVDVSDENTCWEWKSTKSRGYGQFIFNRKQYRSHRVAYLLHYGIDPKELLVCHSCDNRICCNPNHLFLGTHSDNTKDMMNKKRNKFNKGEESHSAKISEQDAIDIIRLRKEGVTRKVLAKKYSMCVDHISRIGLGKKWKHLQCI